jgi:hypothetical protein
MKLATLMLLTCLALATVAVATPGASATIRCSTYAYNPLNGNMLVYSCDATYPDHAVTCVRDGWNGAGVCEDNNDASVHIYT